MKTNREFYLCLEWIEEHGIDFNNQFKEELVNACCYYKQETGYPYNRNKTEVLKEIRNNTFKFQNGLFIKKQLTK